MSFRCEKVDLRPALPSRQSVNRSLNSLSRDMFCRVLFYLDIDAIKSLTLCNKEINRKTAESFTTNELVLIRLFINRPFIQQCTGLSLQDSLSGVLGRIASLDVVIESIELAESENLSRSKDFILDVRKQLINLAKTSDLASDLDSSLAFQKDERIPFGFKDFFNLVALEKQLDEAKLITDPILQNFELEKIGTRLVMSKHLARAEEVVSLMRSDAFQENVLRAISNVLLQSNRVDDAIRIATWARSECVHRDAFQFQGSLLRDISQTLLGAGRLDKAVEVANLNRNEDARGFLLRDISKELLQSGSIDRAVEVAKSIPTHRVQGVVLQDISKRLLQLGCIDGAIEVANLIRSEYFQGASLEEVSKVLLQSGCIDKAIEIANLIRNEHFQSVSLQGISKALLQSGSIDRAIEVAKLIRDREDRTSLLKNIHETSLIGKQGHK